MRQEVGHMQFPKFSIHPATYQKVTWLGVDGPLAAGFTIKASLVCYGGHEMAHAHGLQLLQFVLRFGCLLCIKLLISTG